MSQLDLQHTVIRDDNFITSRVEDEVVMMSLEKGHYYGLDAIGSYIWEQLDKPTALSDLHDHLLTQFDVDAEQCAADLLYFANQLYQKGMLTLVEDEMA